MTLDQLAGANIAKHFLPSGLLHDLRTPLNQIIGYTELMVEQAADAGQELLVPDLQKVKDAGRQMLALIGDNFAPVENGTLEAERPTEIESLPARAVKHEHAGGMAQGSILVVDDNEANRDVLSRQLEKQGYRTVTAEGGQQALDQLRRDPMDLVLLDIMMPEIDGYQVLQLMKADSGLRHIPVIMISALSELESVARCIELGAEDYLPKPFNRILLKARISSCLEKKRAHDREMSLFSQLEQNYKRLQELERLRDDLTRMIIHDLRTPLTSVITGMQTLEVVGDLNEGQREVMGYAVTGGQNLLGMINDLLDVEKLESGAMQLDCAPISVAELIGSAMAQVTSLAENKSLHLSKIVQADLPEPIADAGKLSRTLVNLLGNAIKFTPEGGTVLIKAGLDDLGTSINFSVQDSGEGIPPEAFDRIFEKFGQVESRQAGRGSSTGLGLTFCKLAVEAHGGSIKVESKPGKGSTFTFTIPA